MLGTPPKVYTRLRLGSIVIPPGTDFDLSEIFRMISDASDIRRTVNGEAVNVARSPFRKYSVGIRASDMRAAGIGAVNPGDYCEVIPSESLSISVPGGAMHVQLPRAGIEVVGIAADGTRVTPVAQPATPLPLQTARTGARIATLRLKPTVVFQSPVTVVRFRPALACIVMSWSSSADERAATASWTLDLEEI